MRFWNLGTLLIAMTLAGFAISGLGYLGSRYFNAGQAKPGAPAECPPPPAPPSTPVAACEAFCKALGAKVASFNEGAFNTTTCACKE